MNSFSERLGYEKPKIEMKFDDVSDELKAGLWDALDLVAFRDITNLHDYDYSANFNTQSFRIWHVFFKRPTDTRPEYPGDAKQEIRSFFLTSSFPVTYNFLEFIAKNGQNSSSFCKFCNQVFEREKIAFRFVGQQLVLITNKTEIAEIEKAQNQKISKSVAEHFDTAVSLYSDREKPDYRNSIKESISAVEAAAKELAGKPNVTLGAALKVLGNEKVLPGVLKEGFHKLYGWTNGPDGIRHAIMDETNLTEADARYMLVSCSAFANYLLSKKKN